MHPIDLPDQPFNLVCRISTPSNRTDGPKRIDPAYPTILLCHPVWMDSFFFYPQFDDSLLYERYNLIAFDLPGHGFTYLKKPAEAKYTLESAVEAIYLGLIALDVKLIHVVGSGTGSAQAMRLASLHPGLIESMTLIMPSSPDEPTFVKTVFDEWMLSVRKAIFDDDVQSLYLLVENVFDFCTGREGDPAMREMKQEARRLVESKLSSGQLGMGLPIFENLLRARGTMFTMEEAQNIDFPVLIIQDQRAGNESFERMIDIINDTRHRHGEPHGADRVILDGDLIPRWVTLTNPDVLNALISAFVQSKFASLPSLPTIPLTPSITRRPSTPREHSGCHIISPRPRLPPGRKSFRDMMDELEIQKRRQMEKGGVNVEVEIMISVDEVGESDDVLSRDSALFQP
ncbi:hypothetical protein IAR55_000867 [Kwoniella newhampshirensis]|uniref:AB hydrolase-1 domain-containing protein n=1 Tax=Kwoniella newhampshirensis TaxID=1651941 RepID=A0AAW0Z467_9TREE